MYGDNKNENEQERLIQTIRLYSQDRGKMHFVYNAEWELTNSRMNKTTKSRKH